MSKSLERIKARALRRQGKSIKEIASGVGVAKGTASIWCSDIALSSQQLKELHQKAIQGGYVGRMKGARMQKERKLQQMRNFGRQGLRDIGTTNMRDLLMIGLGLYLGEGNKRGNTLQIANSNPAILRVAIRWLTKIFHVNIHNFYCNIIINQTHAHRARNIQRRWSRELGIPATQFRKTILIYAKRKKIYENDKTYLGTLILRVHKSSSLQYRVLGLMTALLYKLKATPHGEAA